MNKTEKHICNFGIKVINPDSPLNINGVSLLGEY